MGGVYGVEMVMIDELLRPKVLPTRYSRKARFDIEVHGTLKFDVSIIYM